MTLPPKKLPDTASSAAQRTGPFAKEPATSATSLLRVHTEFHRLVTDLQDAMQDVMNLRGDEADYLDAYAALTQRRKELYEWVGQNSRAPIALHTVYLRF